MNLNNRNRREFLAEVGRGMLIASVGTSLAAELGVSLNQAAAAPTKAPQDLERLVALLQDTQIEKLLPVLVDKLKDGVDLKTLVAAGAIANARRFGGQDYDGYHTFMALAPSFEMAKDLPVEQRPLPVLKVLYRNAFHMQNGKRKDTLEPVAAEALPKDKVAGELLREAARQRDMKKAEALFAAISKAAPEDAYNDLQYIIQDELNVHRVVLAWRAWVMLDFTGKDHAHDLLRQSVRFCCDSKHSGGRTVAEAVEKILDKHKLLGKKLSDRRPDDKWIEEMATTVYASSGEQAADAVAGALADGVSPDIIAETLSLAGNTLVLRDPGRPKAYGKKGVGSVHGDSPGVHASDAANAWRNIAKVANPRHRVASLVVGAYHTGGQKKYAEREALPFKDDLEKITTKDAKKLLAETEAAIKDKEQARVCALVQRYGALGHPAADVFDLLRKYAVSEDGALHAEKYFQTVREEFAASREAFRWRQLVSLARVTASQYGDTAPGYEEACKLLKV